MDIKVKKNLVLTGMMGVGKSTVGKILSKKLGFNFIDIDKIIEKKEKNSINSIFKIKGESYFRKLETEITLRKLKEDNAVISLGGGAFLVKIIRKSLMVLTSQRHTTCYVSRVSAIYRRRSSQYL